MIKELKMFTIICDDCGKDVNADSGYSGWDDKDYNEEIRQEAGWVKVNQQHFCTDCHSYNDNNELELKDSSKLNIENDIMEVAERLYYYANPDTKMNVPNSAYILAEKWYREWLQQETDLDLFDWCIKTKTNGN